MRFCDEFDGLRDMEKGNWRGKGLVWFGFAIGLEFEGEFEEVKGDE